MTILNNFAVFEGCDGSGTTTQLGILKDFFGSRAGSGGFPLFYPTFEPTEGPIGRIIRAGLKGEFPLVPETVAFLFAADRSEHLYGPDGVAERCARGELVVSDRYVPSSLVYQGLTCGEEVPFRLNRDFPCPELILFFDIDPETAQKRMAGRREKEIYEYLDFQIRVRERYLKILPGFTAAGTRVETIDASRGPEEVAARIWSHIQKMPIFKR
ncbi:MAG: dTMP kinase [Treponema sp.]|jgi:dTMP kinase|nr:dTMP kinase [Treponema sp.]